MRYPTGLDHRVRISCSVCGSTDVRRDAWAEFNEADQRWELGEVFDQGFCADCGGEASLVEGRLGDPEPGKPCCGSCRHFQPRPAGDDRKIAGAEGAEGHCGLRNPAKQEGMTLWRRRADWCDRYSGKEGSTT